MFKKKDYKLYNDNCLSTMDRLIKKGATVDIIIADPPYGTTQCKWDTVIAFDKLWDRYYKLLKDDGVILVFGAEPFSSNLRLSDIKNFKYDWIWEKPSATGHLNAKKQPMRAYEIISVFYKKQPLYNPQKTTGHTRKVVSIKNRIEAIKNSVGKDKVYNDGTPEKATAYDSTERYPRNVIKFSSDKQKCAIHPTQKPVTLLEYLIKTYTNDGDTVLVPFMGSGTTVVACLNTGRKCIAVEKDETYFKLAKERIKNV